MGIYRQGYDFLFAVARRRTKESSSAAGQHHKKDFPKPGAYTDEMNDGHSHKKVKEGAGEALPVVDANYGLGNALYNPADAIVE